MSTKTKSITLKQYGQNMALTIDGKKHVKRMPEAKDREDLKAKVEEYNKKPLVKRQKAIIEIMLENKSTESSRETKAKKESKASKVPKVKKTKEPKVKKLSKEDKIAEAKKFLQENDFTVSKKAAPSYRGSRREY